MVERRTSAAKDILTPDTERLLEQYGFVSQEFDQAREVSIEHQTPDEARTEDRAEGSRMVQDDGPKYDMRPPPEIAEGPDRETFDKKWFDEQVRSDQHKEDRGPEWEPERGLE